jgi:hypothetical protein
LANSRVTNALDSISLIGNLANPKNYKWTDADADMIEQALMKGVEMTMVYFRKPRENALSFRLPEEC